MPLLNIEELKKYSILYFFVCEPYIIFNALTTADALIHFNEKLEVPKEIGVDLVTCYFSIYNLEGVNIDTQVKTVNSQLLNNVSNEVPFLMLQKLGLIQISQAEKEAMNSAKIDALNSAILL